MNIQVYKSNPNGDFSTSLINEEEAKAVKKPYTLVPPPTPNWKPVFNFKTNRWEETATKQEIDLYNLGVTSLDELKESKKQELSTDCTEAVLNGFKTTINDKEYWLSYDKEAQANLTERWQLFQNSMITDITITVHSTIDDSHKRLTVNKDQYEKIYMDSVKHKEDCISRLHDVLIPMVDNAVTIEQVKNINWSNKVIMPQEPSITISDEATLDKEITKTSKVSTKAMQSTDLNSMALMEFMNMFVGQNNI